MQVVNVSIFVVLLSFVAMATALFIGYWMYYAPQGVGLCR